MLFLKEDVTKEKEMLGREVIQNRLHQGTAGGSCGFGTFHGNGLSYDIHLYCFMQH